MVKATDLKSVGVTRVGSNPTAVETFLLLFNQIAKMFLTERLDRFTVICKSGIFRFYEIFAHFL